jgi:alpha-D-xyloside xylohydrolase
LAEFRQRQIPIDNIVLDGITGQKMRGKSHFDKNRFPDPKAMVDSIHSMNAQIMISVWPKFYHTTANFKAFKDIGAMYMRAVEDSIRDWVGPGYVGSFYDAYNEEAKSFSGVSFTKNYIRWVSMHGGWMPANPMYATVPTWIIAKLCVAPQRLVLLPSTSMLMR